MADTELSTPLRAVNRPVSRPPDAPRKRRSAAVGALSKLAPSNLAKYMESAAAAAAEEAAEASKDRKADSESDQEEEEEASDSEETSAKRQRSGEPKTYEETKNDVIRRQRKTIKRLEEDVDRLKREAIVDKRKIETLNVAIVQHASAAAAAAATPAPASALPDKVLDSLLETILAKQLGLLRKQERCDKLEKNVTELHKRAYPTCVACQVSAGIIELDHPKHRVCLSCIDALSSGAKTDEKTGEAYFPCPICKGRINRVNLSDFNISAAAGSKLESWSVNEDMLDQYAWDEMAPVDRSNLKSAARERLRHVLRESGAKNLSGRIDTLVDEVVTGHLVRDHVEPPMQFDE